MSSNIMIKVSIANARKDVLVLSCNFLREGKHAVKIALFQRENLHKKYTMLIYKWANKKFPPRLFPRRLCFTKQVLFYKTSIFTKKSRYIFVFEKDIRDI